MGSTTVTRTPQRENEIARPKQIATKISTDDDNRLPDLFPAEVKIPPPDSPERPFTLDPLTVTVLGKAKGGTKVAVENLKKEDEALKKEASDAQQIVLATEENTQIQQAILTKMGRLSWPRGKMAPYIKWWVRMLKTKQF